MQQKSSIEQRFSEYLHEYRVDNLTDKNGEPFNAVTDAIYDGVLIELKDHPLNTVRTICASANKLSAQLAYRIPHFRVNVHETPDCQNELSNILWNMGFYHDCLKWGFNHSAEKQSIVSKHLASQGKRLIIIFSKHPSFIKWYGKKIPFRQFYKDQFELEVMLESEFWEQAGIKAA